MNIYFSGILGKGLSALSMVAMDVGHRVWGSDMNEDSFLDDLREKGAEIHVGEQTSENLARVVAEHGVDWFVYSSAIRQDNPEFMRAQELGLKMSKRGELTNFILEGKGLKMVAVAGTHGKTTTTAMIVWTLEQLGVPTSYIVGSSLPWGPAGKYEPGSEFFIYEADEYDRNFLEFHPWLSVIVSVEHDHYDIYPTEAEYFAVFDQFRAQSEQVIENVPVNPEIKISGGQNRYDASLAVAAVEKILEHKNDGKRVGPFYINSYPGVGNRFEEVVAGVYSDYAHTPTEVTETVKMAREVADGGGVGRFAGQRYEGLAVIYEPLQNSRQHNVIEKYRDVFTLADEVIWLPTYLTREDPNLRVLEPAEFIEKLESPERVKAWGGIDEALAEQIRTYRGKNYLVLMMLGGGDRSDGEIRAMLRH